MNPIRQLTRKFGLELTRYNHPNRMSGESDYALTHLLNANTVNTVFDLGANTGQTATSFRKLFPSATIYSFEPANDTFTQLSQNFRDDQHVKPFQIALTNVDGSRDFHVNADPTCSSLLAPSDNIAASGLRNQLKEVGCVTVQCAKLDSFCKDHSISKIDLLKMDIQGAELQAIEGASGLLEQASIDIVYSEVLFSQLYKNACVFSEVFDAMRKFGYSLYGLYSMHHFEEAGLLWGDAIFLSPNCKPHSR